MTIVFVGIDLAKNVFAVHGMDPASKAEMVLRLAAAALRTSQSALGACCSTSGAMRSSWA
jgi:hypothetical protein